MQIGQWLLVGLFSFLIIEKIFPESEDGECDDESSSSEVASSDGCISDASTDTFIAEQRIVNGKIKKGARKRVKKKLKEYQEQNGYNAKDYCNGNVTTVANGHCNVETTSMANGHCNGKATSVTNGHCNGKSISMANGHCNGKATLTANGHCNGKATSIVNGYCNGTTLPKANGYCNGKSLPVLNGECNGKLPNGYSNGKSSLIMNGYCNGKMSVTSNGHCNGNVSTVATANGHCNAMISGEAGTLDPQTNKGAVKKTPHIKTSGWLNLMANVIDNFTHGLAVAGSYCISPKMGMLTTFAILLHEIPHEIGDFAILLRAGFDRWKAAKAQFFTAFGGIIGALLALSAESVKSAGDTTAWILPFTAGGFIYIALVTVVPDLMKENNPWNSLKQVLLLCTGIATMGIVTVMVD